MQDLLEIARAERVHVVYGSLAEKDGIYGMYFRDEKGRPIIILDDDLHHRPRLKRCVLAEEIGHHLTAPTTSFYVAHISYSLSVDISRDEARALRWAANHLIPTKRLAEAAERGIQTTHDIADYFFVTEWMVYRKYQFLRTDLREQMKLRVRRRDIMSPLLVATQLGQSIRGYLSDGRLV